jgi:hypothetical protein
MKTRVRVFIFRITMGPRQHRAGIALFTYSFKRFLTMGLTRTTIDDRFGLQKRRQLFICPHNETLSVARDCARIVFDCRMTDDPAMMSSTR